MVIVTAAAETAAAPTNPNVPQASPAADSTYAASVQAALGKSNSATWKNAPRAVADALKSSALVSTVVADIAADGSARAIRMAVPSGKNAVDDFARQWVLATEPFAPPATASLSPDGAIPCVIRVAFAGGKGKTPAMNAAVACLHPNQSIAVAPSFSDTGTDAAAQLFMGWQKELAGNLEQAASAYHLAAVAAPNWDLAARSFGMILVRGKRAADAVPFLKTYVAANSGAADAVIFGRELLRFDQMQAEAKKPHPTLAGQDIAQGVRKGYALLEPCLQAARAKRALGEGVDTLTLSWTINKDGTVHGAHLEGPSSILMTADAECIEQAVGTWQFPQYTSGSDVAVKALPIKVRGSPPPPATTASAANSNTAVATAAEMPLDEPTFSTCERTPEEIGAYIRARLARVTDCVVQEHKRDANTPFPEELPLSFVVDTDGSVRGVRVNHRYFREGPLAMCMNVALGGSLAPSTGADCPADFKFDLRKAGF